MYAVVVVVRWLTVEGMVAVVITTAGAMLVGLYYAAIRQNLPPGPSGSPS